MVKPLKKYVLTPSKICAGFLPIFGSTQPVLEKPVLTSSWLLSTDKSTAVWQGSKVSATQAWWTLQGKAVSRTPAHYPVSVYERLAGRQYGWGKLRGILKGRKKSRKYPVNSALQPAIRRRNNLLAEVTWVNKVKMVWKGMKNNHIKRNLTNNNKNKQRPLTQRITFLIWNDVICYRDMVESVLCFPL